MKMVKDPFIEGYKHKKKYSGTHEKVRKIQIHLVPLGE